MDDIVILKEKYVDACKRYGIPPNMAIISSLFMGSIKDFQHGQYILKVSLDNLKDSDFLPLYDLFTDINVSVIDEVDIYNKTQCIMNGSYLLSLLRAVNKKLRAVHLIDLSLEKGFLRDLSQRGLTCKELSLSSSRLRKLNLTGCFEQLQTLNLDFNTSLTSFQEGCFSRMPKLKHLSVCATRVSNLWTTTAALSKLPSLVELRFQNCLCCSNTGLCPKSASQRTLDGSYSRYDDDSYVSASSRQSLLFHQPYSLSEEMFHDVPIIEDTSFSDFVLSPSEDVSEDREGDAPNYSPELSFPELLSHAFHNFDLLNGNTVPLGISSTANGDNMARRFYDKPALSLADPGTEKYLTHHPSPICFEKHYRDFMIASLPQLQILDNLPIDNSDRESSKVRYSKNFECFGYRRGFKESVVSILSMREMNTGYPRLYTSQSSCHHSKSAHYYSRSLGAAKLSSSAWPLVQPLPTSGYVLGDEIKSFRPRQFEYHPSDPSLMAFGTLDGEVVAVNHENGKICSYIPSLGAMNSVLGLCWLKKFPSKLIAGSDNGSLRLYDTQHWQSAVSGRSFSAIDVVFDEFDQLTSVHVNATDELFVASGYSKNVALYDINSGKRLNVFADMHQQHINVVKFSHHSPSVFATSSFDQDVKMWDLRQGPVRPCFKASSSQGNVMVCFSPDDLYLLLSAVDNEVKQLSAVDGRLLLDFDIAATGSSQNYTRSYYMNGRDYIISGSCDENVVRICCAQTGRRLRDISLEGKHSGASMFVQSLRGDPFRDFNMGILAAYMRPSSKSEIIKVNLLASSDCGSDLSDDETYLPSLSMGG